MDRSPVTAYIPIPSLLFLEAGVFGGVPGFLCFYHGGSLRIPEVREVEGAGVEGEP